jgi:WD40 repeat protein
MPGLFLSYARADGETRAAELVNRLARDAPEIVIKQDRLFLEGGVGWWKQITDAIDSAEFLVLLMTPAALASDNVAREWRHARQQGVCVYPVKAACGSELQFGTMPRWMSRAHFYDLDKEWPNFLAHLRKGCNTPRVPFMPPDLPAHFIQRPAEYEALKTLLLTEVRDRHVAITTALAGGGGFGKTTLAIALCHDEDIVENFDDGILWVTLGQTPNVMSSLLTVYTALTGDTPGFTSVEDGTHQLGRKLEERTCLLVIDDVWDQEHLRPFLRGGRSVARLFTTRDTSIASGARAVNVDRMRESEAMSMLARSAEGLGTDLARKLSHRLGEWPLALELVSAMIRERVRHGEGAARAADRLLKIVERKGVGTLQDPAAERRHRTISSVLAASLDLLDASDRRRFAELSIFPEDVAIPLAAAAAVWSLDEIDSENLAQRLSRLSLLEFDLFRGVLRLHDVVRRWLVLGLANPGTVHDRLVNAWPDWRNLPDLPGQYAWRWLAWHLARSGRNEELHRILWEPEWMHAKLRATDVNSLISDYELLKPSAQNELSESAELLQGALRLSANVLAADKSEFASQLVGRLMPHSDSLPIRQFAIKLAAGTQGSWLRPLWPALHPPGTSLIRTLEDHSSSVHGIAVTPDGKRAVSASEDETLKVWDVESGRVLHTLKGHSSSVRGVAVTPDGKRAVSASEDQTLKVWNLESGCALHTLEGHDGWVCDVKVTLDGRWAVSASWDALKVWDLESGRALRTLEGHFEDAHGLAVTPNGKWAVSASRNNTLKVWDLETSLAVRALEGHSDLLTAVEITPDGKRAVSASEDKTLKVWDLESGRALRTLEGHTDRVCGVAVTPDGKRVLSASADGTVKVWDLEGGQVLRTLEGHTGWVFGVAVTPDGERALSVAGDQTLKVWNIGERAGCSLALHRREGHRAIVHAVAVTPDGKRAVSASWDKTLRIWDLESGRALRTLEGHSGWVTGVAVTPEGKRAVSASQDRTLRVWDLENGRALRTLQGHSSSVGDVAVTPDGKRAVSASDDHTLRVWDLESGRALRTLQGHSSSVGGVAVTPDGKRAVSASWDNTLKVWELESGRALHTLQGHSDHVCGVAVTPDEKRAVSASWDKTLKLWDLETGCALRTYEGHSDRVWDVAVAPDGKRVVSGSAELKVWDLDTGLSVATFHCDSVATCCTFVSQHEIIAADGSGQLHFFWIEEPLQRYTRTTIV